MIRSMEHYQSREYFAVGTFKDFTNDPRQNTKLVPLAEHEEYCCTKCGPCSITRMEFPTFLQFDENNVLIKAEYYAVHRPQCCAGYDNAELEIYNDKYQEYYSAECKDPYNLVKPYLDIKYVQSKSGEVKTIRVTIKDLYKQANKLLKKKLKDIAMKKEFKLYKIDKEQL